MASNALPRRFYSPSLGITVQTKRPATQTKKPQRRIVVSSKLIPGDGEPLENGTVVVEDGVIIWLGSRGDIPEEYLDGPHQLHVVPYLMPGLWDCHVHFGGTPDDETSRYAAIAPSPVPAGARLARGCWDTLQRGYTSVRDVAGFGCELAKTIAEGKIVGPNVYSSGSALSQLAGHGDEFDVGAGDILKNLGVSEVKSGWWGTTGIVICDGVDECRRAVRLQIRRGAKCIKVMASGGVLSTDDDPTYAQFSPSELAVITEEATRFHRSVAAHVHGKPGILAAVNAGVTSVEHVSLADKECIDLIKERGTIYVATRTIVQALMDTGGKGIDPRSWEKAKFIDKRHMDAYKLAVKTGVTCALGTDTMPGDNMAVELEYATQAGMSNLEAIKAATANGPLTVKGQVGKTGQLKVGYEADMLGVFDDPTEDVRTLQDKDKIGWVWKAGRLYKGPGVGPWGE